MRWVRLSVATLILVFLALPALAHPLGNFTTNQHVGLSADSDSLDVAYVVDMAEIPAVRRLEAIDRSGGDLAAAAQEMCAHAADEIDVTAGGDRLPLRLVSSEAKTAPGQASLPTLRFSCGFGAQLPTLPSVIGVANKNFPDRVGWREVVVDRSLVTDTTLPRESPSAVLTNYPKSDPLEVTAAGFTLTGIDAATGSAPVSVTAVSAVPAALGGLLGERLSITAMLAALALGAGHALAPGHGKTLMAAYLVGQRGRPRHAVGLGLVTALSHTLGVAALGVVTLVASESFAPERVYPVLSVASGLIITLVGVVMLVRAVKARTARHHGHHHHGHDHHHEHDASSVVTWKGMAVMGLAGGLVPSASAVVLLLGAVNLGRPFLGLVLVAMFGVGMSTVLVASGMAVLSTRHLADRVLKRSLKTTAWLRPAAAGVVVTVGTVLTASALSSF